MSRQSTGYVYFVLSPVNNVVKIGYSSRHPDARLGDFRVGCPVELRRHGFIRGGPELERELHRRFRHLRSHGEWFRLGSDLDGFIEKYAEDWYVTVRLGEEDRKAGRDQKYRDTIGAFTPHALNLRLMQRFGLIPADEVTIVVPPNRTA